MGLDLPIGPLPIRVPTHAISHNGNRAERQPRISPECGAGSTTSSAIRRLAESSQRHGQRNRALEARVGVAISRGEVDAMHFGHRRGPLFMPGVRGREIDGWKLGVTLAREETLLTRAESGIGAEMEWD